MAIDNSGKQDLDALRGGGRREGREEKENLQECSKGHFCLVVHSYLKNFYK